MFNMKSREVIRTNRTIHLYLDHTVLKYIREISRKIRTVNMIEHRDLEQSIDIYG